MSKISDHWGKHEHAIIPICNFATVNRTKCDILASCKGKDSSPHTLRDNNK